MRVLALYSLGRRFEQPSSGIDLDWSVELIWEVINVGLTQITPNAVNREHLNKKTSGIWYAPHIDHAIS